MEDDERRATSRWSAAAPASPSASSVVLPKPAGAETNGRTGAAGAPEPSLTPEA
jgi:hypothetical protein